MKKNKQPKNKKTSKKTYTEEDIKAAQNKVFAVLKEKILCLEDENLSLRRENKKLKRENIRLQPKGRGRPKKKQSTFGALLSGEWKPIPTKGKAGRRANFSKAEMKEILVIWEHKKSLVAKQKGKKSITDKEMFDHWRDTLDKDLPRADKNKRYRKGRARIKSFRGKTGIRTRKNKKRQIPLK